MDACLQEQKADGYNQERAERRCTMRWIEVEKASQWKTKIDNLIFYAALVSWLILPFLVLFGVTYNILFYIAVLAVHGPLRIGYHYMTN